MLLIVVIIVVAVIVLSIIVLVITHFVTKRQADKVTVLSKDANAAPTANNSAIP